MAQNNRVYCARALLTLDRLAIMTLFGSKRCQLHWEKLTYNSVVIDLDYLMRLVIHLILYDVIHHQTMMANNEESR